jgi:hypothetical protein
VVGLDAVVGVVVGSVPGRGQHFLEHARVHRCVVGDDLDRVTLVVPIARWKNR